MGDTQGTENKVMEYRRKLASLTPTNKRIWDLSHTMLNKMMRSENADLQGCYKSSERHANECLTAEGELLELLAAPASTARLNKMLDEARDPLSSLHYLGLLLREFAQEQPASHPKTASTGEPPEPTNPEDVPDLYRLAYMPGVWRCPKCEFVLVKSTLSASSASIGTTPTDRQSEECPNDGEWMVPVTYKESLKQCEDRLLAALEKEQSK